MFNKITCLAGLALLCLPLSLFAQLSDLHHISRSTGTKYSLTQSDFNGDGFSDLLVGAELGVYWIPNAGDGTGFKAPRFIGADFSRAAAGDLDQDGDPDVVCAYSTSAIQGLAWFRNDGQGGFTLVKTWGASAQAYRSVEVADMDGDGAPDVVAMNYWNPNRIAWFKNLDGAGTLSDAILIKNSYSNEWMKPLDVDSDGDMDMVYNSSQRPKWIENTNGLGTAWGPENELNSSSYAYASSGEMADIDGDGKKDLVLTLFGPGLVWFKRTASGLGPQKSLLQGVDARLFHAIVDSDGDGDVDVVASDAGKMIHFRNNGSGVFQYAYFDSQEAVTGMTMLDVDLDGDQDLAAINRDPEKVIWYANTSGNFGSPRFVSADYKEIGGLALADLDLDGDLDVVAANDNPGTQWTDIKQLVWYENQGGFIVRQHAVSFDTIDFSRVQVADFDGDNDPDILSASANPFNVSWFENDGTGRFDSVHPLISSQGASGLPTPEIVATDVDADGDPDIGFSIFGGAAITYKVHWFQNLDGAGTFSPIKQLPHASYALQTAFLDVNGDQAPDMICRHNSTPNDFLWVGYADSAGFFTKQVDNFRKIQRTEDMIAGDLDGDGKDDLVVTGVTGLFALWSKTYFAVDTLVLTPDASYGGSKLAISDYDLDGDNDLLVGRYVNTLAEILWYENTDGLGTLNPPLVILDSLLLLYISFNMACGDLDGDLDPDIVLSGGNPTQIFWNESPLAGSRTISGRCFWDQNASGLPESNETGLQQLPIKVSPLPRSVYTTSDGQFRFYVPPGDFEVTFEPNDCQKLTTPATLQANTIDASVDSLFFGVQYNPDSSGLRGWLLSSPTRCDRRVEFRLILESTGCVAESGSVTLRVNDLADFYAGFPSPQTVTADSLVWNFQDIPPGNRHEITVLFQIAGADHIGDSVRIQVLPRTTTGGVNTERTRFDYVSAITCAYDPNDKQVWPARGADNRVNDGEELLYTIRFQNTGTDTAFRVVVQDRLSPDLDWATLRPLGASHPFTSSLSENGLLEFRFDNILLPDSAANQAGSQGFVSFLVRLRAGLPLNTVIGNTADIYFDLNPPIITNTVRVRRYDGMSSVDVHAEAGRSVRFYPNPFSERLHFQWNDSRDAAPVRLELWDMTQRLIHAVRLPGGPAGTLDIPGLEHGFYLYRVVREGDQAVLGSGKLIRL